MSPTIPHQPSPADAGEEPVLTGDVVWPDDPRYDEARSEYNEIFDVHPRVIVFCKSAEDVRNAVKWAGFHAVPIRARCGRHSYEGWSTVQDGIVVDVSWMDLVQVDADAGTARVEAGIDLWPLYVKLWEHGVTIPGGSCPTVGISGLVLGGGFGLLGRWLGLTCDSLLAVEMVTAQGESVYADEQVNEDLYWACLGGGGGNFGIATAFTFGVTPIGDVSIYNISWSWSDLPAVLQAWQAWAPGADDRLTSILKLTAASSGSISSIGEFVGGKDELAALLQPLLASAPATSVEIRTEPYIEAVEYFAGLKPGQIHWSAHWHGDHTRFKNTSAYAYDLFGPDAVERIMDALRAAPNASGLVQLDAYGGAVARVPPAATAFYHRAGVQWNMQFQAYWTDPADQDANVAWVEAFRESLLPFTRGAYVNYIDRDVADWQEQYYGGNFARLTQVKAAWDPGNVFNYPQSIPVGPAPGLA
ncbi:MAG TPA: FAD-binding oxidoreductase [Longimicrobium sp.]|nr:FAD-binding oxidoreductase [Longimicrobium sp.]